MRSHLFQQVHRKTIATVLIAAMAVSGCVSPRAQYISANDLCSPIREPFVQIKERQNQQIAAWTAAGAAAGLATGAAIGAASSNNRGRGALVGALVGALTGALAGALTGYYSNLQERANSTSGLRNVVFKDAQADFKSADKLVNAVTELNECRLQSVQRIAVEFQQGRLSKNDAKAQLDQLRAAADADNDLVSSVVSGLEKRNSVYVGALDKAGAEDTEAYLTRINDYKPQIKDAEYTIARGGSSERINRRSNVRAGPGTSHEIVAKLDKGEKVEVLERQRSWSRIDFGLGEGWISNSLLGKRRSANRVRGVSISGKDRARGGNAIERTGKATKDLDALNDASAETILASIDDTEALIVE